LVIETARGKNGLGAALGRTNINTQLRGRSEKIDFSYGKKNRGVASGEEEPKSTSHGFESGSPAPHRRASREWGVGRG